VANAAVGYIPSEKGLHIKAAKLEKILSQLACTIEHFDMPKPRLPDDQLLKK
jgi:hypothetical protein